MYTIEGHQFQGCEDGAFTPVLAKHSKHFSLQDSVAIGVDGMQRNFEPMRRQVEQWRDQQLSTAAAKLIIYRAFMRISGQFPNSRQFARYVDWVGPDLLIITVSLA